jgi:YVTN family beta-propeller protein
MKNTPFLLAFCVFLLTVQGSKCYEIFVSNERGGDVTVISGANFQVVAHVQVGKRPRGIHASPDGKIIYVAVSGTPVEPAPQLDRNGNPVLQMNTNSDEVEAESDKSADGIVVLDAAHRSVLHKFNAGSDPENFALNSDGTRIFISNEDVGAATVLNALNGKVITFVPVSSEPEGVGVSPDGKFFYVTCETTGDIFAINAKTYDVFAHFLVHPRPRSAAFLPDSSRAFIPSESVGEINEIDTAQQKTIAVIKLPKGSRPMTVKVSPDGTKVFATTGRGGTVVVLDAQTGELLNTIQVGKRPWGMAFSPDGKYLFTANGPSDDISVVDLGSEKEIARVKSPGSPWGVETVTDGR